MSSYREYAPPSHLAPFIECFWTSEIHSDQQRRVLPDGCSDLLFTYRDDVLVDAQVVGVMTRAHFAQLTRGQSILGVRFHPGMAQGCLEFPILKLNDRTAPLRTVMGTMADNLQNSAACSLSITQRIDALGEQLIRLPRVTQVQRAIGDLVGRKGQLAVSDFANSAGVSERQLRRLCQTYAGLSPKHLARILRFRHVVAKLRDGVCDFAGLAVDCGYCDQSHLIRDFRELAGISPARYQQRFHA